MKTTILLTGAAIFAVAWILALMFYPAITGAAMAATIAGLGMTAN